MAKLVLPPTATPGPDPGPDPSPDPSPDPGPGPSPDPALPFLPQLLLITNGTNDALRPSRLRNRSLADNSLLPPAPLLLPLPHPTPPLLPLPPALDSITVRFTTLRMTTTLARLRSPWEACPRAGT